MQEVAVVQSLQAEVVKLQIALGLQGGGKALEVILHEALVEQVIFNAFFDKARKVIHIGLLHVVGLHIAAKYFLGNGVEQQACCGKRVVWVFFDQGARRQDGGFVNLVHGDAVVQIALGFSHDGVGFDICP